MSTSSIPSSLPQVEARLRLRRAIRWLRSATIAHQKAVESGDHYLATCQSIRVAGARLAVTAASHVLQSSYEVTGEVGFKRS